mgnify:FL=1
MKITNLEEKIISDIIELFNTSDTNDAEYKLVFYKGVFNAILPLKKNTLTSRYIDFFFEKYEALAQSETVDLDLLHSFGKELKDMNLKRKVPNHRQYIVNLSNPLEKQIETFDNFQLLNFSINQWLRGIILRLNSEKDVKSVLTKDITSNLKVLCVYMNQSPVDEDIILAVLIENILSMDEDNTEFRWTIGLNNVAM